MNTASIVSRVWSFCTTLRDDGVGYGDYLHIKYPHPDWVVTLPGLRGAFAFATRRQACWRNTYRQHLRRIMI
jgi:hypothetical protein